MYQTIHEKVAVVGVYNHAAFAPKKFLWKGRTYRVDEITLVSDVKDGGVQRRLYGVVAGGNVYRLAFNRMSETWMLEEVWCE
jgi:hypothetical protein